MIRVRMARRITGLRDGAEWPEIGDEVDLPDWEAANLVSAGAARYVLPVEPSPVGEGPGGSSTAPVPEDAATSGTGETPRRRRKG